MKRTTIFCVLLLVTTGFGRKGFAQLPPDNQSPIMQESNNQSPGAHQSAPHEHFYHLDFVVEDLNAEGKVVNSRNYSTAVSTDTRRTMSIRSGSKIPIATGSYSGGDGKDVASSLVNLQYQYEDVGANFDINNVHEVSNQLAFDVTATLSSVAEALDPHLHEPVIRENKWEAWVLIPVGKQSAIFNADSVDSKGSTRVLVTATAIQ